MRIAYADPPYPGQAKKHYGNQGGSEVDHAELLTNLQREYDGWALSTSSVMLPVMFFALLREDIATGRMPVPKWDQPDTFWFWCQIASKYMRRTYGIRTAAWVKRFSAGKPNVIFNYAWEPIILRPVRRPRELMVDWVSANADIGSHRANSSDTKGTKPAAFCTWLFSALGMRPEDELVDLFPGSGVVSRTWETWRRQMPAEGLSLEEWRQIPMAEEW